MPAISVNRIYDPPTREDCVRVLVDRLWPRGVSKKNAMIDLWAKDLAPSFAHDPSTGRMIRPSFSKMF